MLPGFDKFIQDSSLQANRWSSGSTNGAQS